MARKSTIKKKYHPYEQVIEGKWTDENWGENLHQCCDCGLVHKTSYRLKNGKLQSRIYRAERETAQIRRFSKIRIIRKKNEKDKTKNTSPKTR